MFILFNSKVNDNDVYMKGLDQKTTLSPKSSNPNKFQHDFLS